MGAAQATCTQAVPLCRFATFPPPRGGIVPRTPRGLPFLVGRKGSKRPFRGIPLTGAVPLCHFVTFPPHSGGIVPKDPQGERSGRPARGPSPFVATRHFPRTAGESSPPPTAGILGGNSRRIESQQVRSFTGKFCTLIRISQNRATARQAVSLILGASGLESSKCNLAPFRTG